MAFILACLSLLCAIGNDLIYHRRSHGSAQRAGQHLLLVAVVWTVIFVPPALLMGHCGYSAVVWGTISGIAGIGAHLLLLSALRTGDLGTCSTIYRLNLVPAAIIAIALFGEQLTPIKALAIAIAAGAVALLAKGTKAQTPQVFRLAVYACLLRAGMALSYKQGLIAGAEAIDLLAINGIAWCIGALMWMYYTRPVLATVQQHTAESWIALGWGLASGVLVSGNVLFLMLALAQGQLSTVLPITQLSFVATAAIACALGNESAAPRRITGIACAALSVILLALT